MSLLQISSSLRIFILLKHKRKILFLWNKPLLWWALLPVLIILPVKTSLIVIVSKFIKIWILIMTAKYYFNIWRFWKVSLVSFPAVTPQKMKFSNKDLVTITEEILNGKLHFLCSVWVRKNPRIFVLFFDKKCRKSLTKFFAKM